MTPWLSLAVLATLIWAFVSHFDNYVIKKYFTGAGGPGTLIYTALIGGFIAPLILLFDHSVVHLGPGLAWAMMTNGALLVAAFIPYVYAMQRSDTTVVMSVYETIPLFAFFLGLVILHESLRPTQIAGVVLIILGAIVLIAKRSHRSDWAAFWLMLISSILIAVMTVMFKDYAEHTSYWQTTFWQYCGGLLAGGVLLLIPVFRRSFITSWRAGARRMLRLNAVSEVLNAIAMMINNVALLLAPVALVSAVGRFLSVFTLLMGVAFARWLPWFSQEQIDRRTIGRRALAIVIMVAGVFLVNVG